MTNSEENVWQAAKEIKTTNKKRKRKLNKYIKNMQVAGNKMRRAGRHKWWGWRGFGRSDTGRGFMSR